MNTITFWENKKRRELLEKYKNHVEKYYEAADVSYTGNLVDNNDSKKIRNYLNINAIKTKRILNDARLLPIVTYTPPPIIGGYVQQISLIDNLFNLQKFDIPISELTDSIDKAVGVYEQDYTKSIVRTFNPLYWVGKLIEIASEIPFYLLGTAGFDKNRIENSFWGQLVKKTIRLILGVATFLTVFQGIWSLLSMFKILPGSFNLIAWFVSTIPSRK